MVVYRPESPLREPGRLLRELARDLRAGRYLAWRLFVRDLSAQYRQTFLGYLWAFLPPLVASGTFIFLQSQGVVQVNTGGVPYPAFAFMGTLLWQVFMDSVASPPASLGAAKPMLVKINFPRESVLVAGMLMVGFNFLIRLALLVVVMAVWGVVPGPTLALFPVAVLGLMLGGFTVGLAMAPLSGLYGDFGRAIPILGQIWMLLTPVVYPVREGSLLASLAVWNPAAPLIVTARETLTGMPLSHPGAFVAVLAGSILLSFLGLLGFRLAMPHLIARMGG